MACPLSRRSWGGTHDKPKKVCMGGYPRNNGIKVINRLRPSSFLRRLVENQSRLVVRQDSNYCLLTYDTSEHNTICDSRAKFWRGQIHYARKFEYYAFERHPKKPSIMPEIMLEKYSIMLTWFLLHSTCFSNNCIIKRSLGLSKWEAQILESSCLTTC